MPIRGCVVVGLLLAATACVTLDGEKRLVAERRLTSTCEPGRTTGFVDPAMRDTVRLVFNAVQNCTELYEAVYSQEQSRKLGDAARWTIAAGAALITAVPIVAGVASKPGQEAISRATNAGNAFWLLLIPPLVVGVLSYVQLGGTTAAPLRESVERRERTTKDPRPASGLVTGPGIAAPGREVVAGAVDFTLDEAEGLGLGEFYLDGARVELLGDAVERLSFLPSCREAMAGFEAGTGGPPPALSDARWRAATACDSHGWGFADLVLMDYRPRLFGH